MAPISLKKGKVDKIAQDLVKSITNIDNDSENFKLSLDFAVSNFRFHKFLDVNPFDINRKFTGLTDKFAIHCQQLKADHLISLKDKFLSKPFSATELSENTEDHYSVLSLLLNLSVSPTYSEYVPPVKPTLAAEEDINWTEYLLEGEDELETGIYITEDQRIALEDSDDESVFVTSDAVGKNEESLVSKEIIPEINGSSSGCYKLEISLYFFRNSLST